MKLVASTIIGVILSSNVYAVDCENTAQKVLQSGSADYFDGGSKLCLNSGGDEIKQCVQYSPGPGKYFLEDSVQASPKSGQSKSFHGPATCEIQGVKRSTISVKLQNGKSVPLSVINSFTIGAHADCGSGIGPIAAHPGDPITIECITSAETGNLSDLQ